MTRKLITIEQMARVFEQRQAGVRWAAIAFELGFHEDHIRTRMREAEVSGFAAFKTERKTK